MYRPPSALKWKRWEAVEIFFFRMRFYCVRVRDTLLSRCRFQVVVVGNQRGRHLSQAEDRNPRFFYGSTIRRSRAESKFHRDVVCGTRTEPRPSINNTRRAPCGEITRGRPVRSWPRQTNLPMRPQAVEWKRSGSGFRDTPLQAFLSLGLRVRQEQSSGED